jgi:hypothetical protein
MCLFYNTCTFTAKFYIGSSNFECGYCKMSAVFLLYLHSSVLFSFYVLLSFAISSLLNISKYNVKRAFHENIQNIWILLTLLYLHYLPSKYLLTRTYREIISTIFYCIPFHIFCICSFRAFPQNATAVNNISGFV